MKRRFPRRTSRSSGVLACCPVLSLFLLSSLLPATVTMLRLESLLPNDPDISLQVSFFALPPGPFLVHHILENDHPPFHRFLE